MNSFQTHIFNVFILIIFGSFEVLEVYNSVGPNVPAKAFIPLTLGIFLLLLSPWIAREKNRSLVISSLVVIGLSAFFYQPFVENTGEKKIRILVQMISCLLALIFYIKNLVTNRMNKSKTSETDTTI